MFKQQIWSELKLQCFHPLFITLLIFAPIFGFFVGKGVSASQIELFQDHNLHKVIGILNMLALPWAAVILAASVLFREIKTGIAGLISALPPTKVQHQGLIVTGVILSLYLLCILSVSGLFLGLLSQAVALPSFNILLIIFVKMQQLQFMLSVPSLLFFVAIFWLLKNIGSPLIGLYLVTLMLFASYMALASASGSPLMASEHTPSPLLVEVMNYLDWFGLTAFVVRDLNWDIIYLNRLIIAIASILIAFVACLSANSPQKKNNAKLKLTQQVPTKIHPQVAFTFRKVSLKFFVQFISSLSFQLKQFLIHPGTFFISILWFGIVVAEIYPSLNVAETGSTLNSLSMDAINRFMWDLVPMFGSVLCIYLSYTFTWRDQHANFHLITRSLPVSFATIFLSRVILLNIVVFLFLFIACLAGVVAQYLRNSPVDFAEYVRFIYNAGLPLMAKSIAFIAIQSILKQRIVATTICIFLVVLELSPLTTVIGLYHPVFRPFSTPLDNIDSLLNYSHVDSGFWAFTLFWFIVSLLLSYVALLVNKVGGVRPFIKLAEALLFVFLIVAAALQLQFINRQMLKDGKSISIASQMELLANYEIEYKKFENQPQPTIQYVKTEVHIYPQERKTIIKGNYTLLNPHKVAIDSILLGEDWRTPLQEVSLSHPSMMTYDALQGQRIFQLTSSLEPGQEVELQFSLILEQSGYQKIPNHKVLTSGFVYIRGVPILPELGYQPVREISDNDWRQKYGLAKVHHEAFETLLGNRDRAKDIYQWTTLSTIISTPEDFQSFSQGELISEKKIDGRVFRHFETRSAVRRLQAFVALPAQISERKTGDVLLRVAHKEMHYQNVEMTLDAMQQTVEFLTEHLGPFPGKSLTVVEKPDFGPGGYALPQLTLISSKIGFRVDQNDEHSFSHVYRRAAHETAHQWFGHLLGNGVKQDSAFLVESMAKYIELVMLERHHGSYAMQSLIDHETRRYLNAEKHNRKPPSSLVGAENAHDKYSRATLAFAKLRAEIGDDPILAALSELTAKHRFPKAPASSLDFVDILLAKAPAHKELIEMLLLVPVPATSWLRQAVD